MATYEDLFNFAAGGDSLELANKIAVACVDAAIAIKDESPAPSNHAERMAWAQEVLGSSDGPLDMARRMLHAVIVVNKGLSISAIQGASDNAIQNNVNDAVDILAGGV